MFDSTVAVAAECGFLVSQTDLQLRKHSVNNYISLVCLLVLWFKNFPLQNICRPLEKIKGLDNNLYLIRFILQILEEYTSPCLTDEGGCGLHRA